METKVITLSAQDLVDFLGFDADCTISAIESNAPVALASDVVKRGDRVLKINGHAVMDRSELNSFIVDIDPASQVQLEIAVSEITRAGHTVEDFAASVVVDNQASTVSKNAPPSIEEEEFDPNLELEELAEGAPTAVSTPGGSVHNSNDSRDLGKEPSLLGFEPIATAGPGGFLGDKSMNEAARSKSVSMFRTSLDRALAKVALGRVVIMLVEPDVNPLAEIEGMATSSGITQPTLVDFGVKMRNRITDSQLREAFFTSMTKGNWFVVVRANKCLVLLQLLATLLEECHANSLKDINPTTKIIIATEPHPHFPPFLARDSRTMQVRNTMTQSAMLFESIAGSVRKLQFIRDQTAKPAERRKVRISCELDVVDIESRQVFQVESLPVPTGQGKSQKTVGAVSLRHTSSALPNDKFFALARAGDQRRYAVASSLGNLYVIDHRGAALLSAHLHDASVWDTDFHGKDLFVTGAEDSSAVAWRSLPDGNVQRVASMRCPNDIYSVRFTGNGQCFAAGGLMSAMMLRSLSSGAMSTIELQTSIQSMAAHGSTNIIAGGGDGSAFVVDTTTQQISSTLRGIHSKKIPAMSVNGDTLITGSFDSSVRVWDLRSGSTSPQHTMKFKQYITGLDCQNFYLSGCVGDSLYLWDTRKLDCILGGCSKAWAGLSRAVRVDSVDQSIITASPDGVIRFWEFN